jgi:hypothetical protein
MTKEDAAPQPGKPTQLQIELDEATAHGMYINLAMIGHTETEFTMDFIYVQPQQPKGKVRARVISSPSHTKRFLLALQDNIKKYEARFGAIKAAQEPEKSAGFYL